MESAEIGQINKAAQSFEKALGSNSLYNKEIMERTARDMGMTVEEMKESMKDMNRFSKDYADIIAKAGGHMATLLKDEANWGKYEITNAVAQNDMAKSSNWTSMVQYSKDRKHFSDQQDKLYQMMGELYQTSDFISIMKIMKQM